MTREERFWQKFSDDVNFQAEIINYRHMLSSLLRYLTREPKYELDSGGVILPLDLSGFARLDKISVLEFSDGSSAEITEPITPDTEGYEQIIAHLVDATLEGQYWEGIEYA